MMSSLHPRGNKIMTGYTGEKARTSGIILAAGQARRIGTTKQLLPFRESTLLGQVVNNARNSRLDEIIVVLGHDAARIQSHIDLKGINVVINNDYQQGQSTSLLTGLSRISDQADAAMILLGDQPLVDHGIINNLLETYDNSQKSIVIPMFDGRRGNPVIINRDLFGELTATLYGDTGARVVFSRHRENTHFVELDSRCIHVDVDTMEDYHSLLAIDRGHGHGSANN